jgi:hypothetical protein
MVVKIVLKWRTAYVIPMLSSCAGLHPWPVGRQSGLSCLRCELKHCDADCAGKQKIYAHLEGRRRQVASSRSTCGDHLPRPRPQPCALRPGPPKLGSSVCVRMKKLHVLCLQLGVGNGDTSRIRRNRTGSVSCGVNIIPDLSWYFSRLTGACSSR